MNIYQQELSHNEIELIQKVIDFPLIIGSTRICFKDIIDKVELNFVDPNAPEAHREESLTEEQLQQLAEEIKKIETEIQKWEIVLRSYDWFNMTQDEIKALYAKWPWTKRYPEYSLGDYIWLLKERKVEMQNVIQNGGNNSTSRLGFFSPQEKTVFLCYNRTKNTIEIRSSLIVTFIHEMFHAWNFFASGCIPSPVREIDEPMVEFGTLYFLKMLAKKDNSFESIRDHAEESIKKKQIEAGIVAAYGFGYYLYNPKNSAEEKKALKILEVYGKRSGFIPKCSIDVQKAKQALNPLYPFDKESETLELFYKIIVLGAKGIPGQVFSKGKTNIKLADDTFLFSDDVDSITPIAPGIYKIDRGPYSDLYVKSGDIWARNPLIRNYDSNTDEILLYHNERIIIHKERQVQTFYYVESIIRAISKIEKEGQDAFEKKIKEYILQADEFEIKDQYTNQMCVFAKDRYSKSFIFPKCAPKHQITDNDKLYFMQKSANEFVCIENNCNTELYKLGGHQITEWELIVDINSEYPLFKQNNRYNFLSFKEGKVLFKEWFEDAELYEKDNIFVVKSAGEWKAIKKPQRETHTITTYETSSCYESGLEYEVHKSFKNDECTVLSVSVKSADKSLTNASVKERIIIEGEEYVVTSISWNAFNDCDSLTSIDIPDSVVNIGNGAFLGCPNLISIKIGGNNNKYDSRDNCNAIIEKATNTLMVGCKETIIPNSVVKIGDRAFSKCIGLKDINIPESVTSIGNYAFSGCSSLEKVYFPETLNDIGEWAFSGCNSLESICIPKNVTCIGKNALRCDNLKVVTIQSDAIVSKDRNIRESIKTFFGDQVEEYIIRGVTIIGNGAFSGCLSLKKISIPDGIVSIGRDAFSDCHNLQSISIPNSVKFVGSSAFRNCDNLSIQMKVGNSLEASVINLSKEHCQKGKTYFDCKMYDSAVPCFIMSLLSANNMDANYMLGKCYLDGLGVSKNETAALRWMEEPARQGIADAQFVVGKAQLEGVGIKKDEEEAVSWFKKATQQGHKDAQYLLGRCYHEGLGVSKDETEAIKWFKVSSMQGQMEAQYLLGKCYLEGCGVKKDEKEAVKWLEKPAEFGNAEAQYIVGKCYFEGLGVLKDESKAAHWFKKAAEQDNANAKYWLAYCYYYGLGGISSDTETAKKLFMQSEGMGNPDAKKMMDVIAHAPSYTLNKNGTATVRDCDHSVTSIIIDQEIAVHGKKYSVTEIHKGAFSNCKKLESVTISNSVNSIGEDAFCGCETLKSIVIPSSVTRIGKKAFRGCIKMYSVEILSSNVTVEHMAFHSCDNLTSVKVRNKTPFSIYRGDFSNRANARLIVPIDSKSAYENADVWKEFKEIIED